MPITSFPYDATLSGSDLSALLLGADLGTAVEITLGRHVALSWDAITGPVTSRQGREGDACWEVVTAEYTVVWSAVLTETVTKTSKPLPILNRAGGAVSGAGQVIAGIGGALLTWAGFAAVTPAAPAAPIGAVGGGIITGVGAAVAGVGEVLKWLTDRESRSVDHDLPGVRPEDLHGGLVHADRVRSGAAVPDDPGAAPCPNVRVPAQSMRRGDWVCTGILGSTASAALARRF